MKNHISLFLLIALLLSNAISVLAQIGMGGQPHSSAVLDLKSPANDKAFYPPRLTTAQRKAIASPQVGAFVYDLDKGTFYMFDGQNWSPLAFTSANNLAPIDRTASNGAAGDKFGRSVAISGDYAIVGAVDKTNNNGTQGVAYIFVRSGNTWKEQAIITTSDGSSGDGFSGSVAISGDYAIVGAPTKTIGSNTYQGAAYVFARNGNSWTQQSRLTASDGSSSDYFGGSVAISGDYALVGSQGDDNGIIADQGSAYIFKLTVFFLGGTVISSSWSQQAKLTASDGTANDNFSNSVAISGNYALVGSSYRQGAAYVFARSGNSWTQQAKLTASDGTVNDNFSSTVAISDDYAILGAPDKTIGSYRQGAAYIFVRSGSSWSQYATLTASDGEGVDYFGSSVAISGEYAIVGASNDDIGSNADQGSAYIFVRDGYRWKQTRKVSDNTQADTNNGRSVGLSNGTFIIGGPSFQYSKGKVSFGTID